MIHSQRMTELPTTFGKYYLTEKLATGGMAEIFLGKIIGPGGFEKQLVIKQIHPALTGQRHFVDLFVAEAKTLVGLAHGNIVPLYELGVIDDTYFIAMEYIDGPTLWRLSEAMARRGQALDPGLALYIGAELAKGLDYAHRKGGGVIHRDLSPRNVMLSRDGEVKLVDFGIAVAFGGGEGPSDDSMPTGSFPYMSPEQVARQPLTGQSDLFSLGVLLWELLVGERLFARATPDETLAAVSQGPIPAPSSRRLVSAAVDALVLRCLERDPDKRWRDADELLSAINRALYALDPSPGARDVAAVVARYCPPLGREDVETSAPSGHDGSGPGDEDAPTTDVGGPSTQVMEGGRKPKGKRTPTVREASFATHVDFEKVIGRLTPLVPLRAILEEDFPTPGPGPGPEPEPEKTPVRRVERADTDGPTTTVREKPSSPSTSTSTSTSTTTPTPTPTTATTPSSTRWVVLALGVLAIAAIAIWWITRDKAVVTGGPIADAASSPPPADGREPPADGREPDAASSLPPADGREPDAAPRPPPTDAGSRPPPTDAASVSPRASGRLKVGAVPWGEVYLDGTKLPGQAPHTWEVPAGPHQVEVVFPATEDEPEIRRRFTVDVPQGGEETVSADFSR